MTTVTVTLTNPAQTTWTVPSNWSSTNTVTCTASGGSGADGFTFNIPFGGTAIEGGPGGGGGAVAEITNQALTPGQVIPIQIGSAGSLTDTFWNSSSTVRAQAGRNGAPFSPGTGGQASSSVGSTTNSGSNGSANSGSTGGAGGNAASGALTGHGAGGAGGNGPNNPGGSGQGGAIVITYTAAATGGGNRRTQTAVCG